MKNLLLLIILITPLVSGCSLVLERNNGGIAAFEEGPPPVATISRGGKYLGWAVSAPVTLALSPLAMLVSLTPWVELETAIDFSTAPTIGLGYAFQYVVGAPSYAAFSCMTKKDLDKPFTPSASDYMPWGLIAAHQPLMEPARPISQPPPEIIDYYKVTEAEVQNLRQLFSASNTDGVKVVNVPKEYDLRGTIEFYPAQTDEDLSSRPLVLMTPPVEAAFAARYLARRYARKGVHAVTLIPENEFLEAEHKPKQLEAKFRAAVLIARTAIRALSTREDVDEQNIHYFGVSAGGIFGAALLAVEPMIQRSVLAFPGGNLPHILSESTEPGVSFYRESWLKRGMSKEEFNQRLKKHIRTDPLELAPYVDPQKILIFFGAKDTLVPIESGLELRKAMGNPEAYLMAGNHATASLCFGYILRRADRFLLLNEG